MRVYLRWTLAAVAVILLVWIAFKAGQGSQRQREQSGQAARLSQTSKAAWGRVTHEAGFSVELPTGWRVSWDGEVRRIRFDGPDGVRLTIWPVHLGGSIDVRSTPSLALQTLAALADPSLRWQALQTDAREVVRVAGSSPESEADAHLSWRSPSADGGVDAVLTLAQAHPKGLAPALENLRRIAGSLQMPGPEQTPATEAHVKYARWTDPLEQAYTVSVPARWNASGGTVRSSAGSGRPALSLTAPDGRVQVRFGDPEAPDHVAPDPALLAEGFGEGRWYNTPGSEGRLLIRAYRDGLRLASERACTWPEVVLKEARSRSEAAEDVRRIFKLRLARAPVRVTAGESSFLCSVDGQPMCGVSFAVPTLFPSDVGGGIWYPAATWVIVASPDRMEVGFAVLEKILRTLRYEPAWWQAQPEHAGSRPDAMHHLQAALAKTLADSYWRTHRVPSPSAGEAPAGPLLARLTDPVTKQTFEIRAVHRLTPRAIPSTAAQLVALLARR